MSFIAVDLAKVRFSVSCRNLLDQAAGVAAAQAQQPAPAPQQVVVQQVPVQAAPPPVYQPVERPINYLPPGWIRQKDPGSGEFFYVSEYLGSLKKLHGSCLSRRGRDSDWTQTTQTRITNSLHSIGSRSCIGLPL